MCISLTLHYLGPQLLYKLKFKDHSARSEEILPPESGHGNCLALYKFLTIKLIWVSNIKALLLALEIILFCFRRMHPKTYNILIILLMRVK